MTWPYDQSWEEARIYGYSLDNPTQTFPHLAPDLNWSAHAEFEMCIPNAVPVTSNLSPRPQLNSLAAQGGSTRAMSPSVPHQPNTSNPVIVYPNPPKESAVISRGENNTRNRARGCQISSSPPHSPHESEFQCKWDGCGYRGTFKRESSLIRHIRKIHVSPLAHLCTVEGCDKAFNRADNLVQHTRNKHYTY
ncbi:hypothetical protein N7516_006181 [Penicillium verrucosum]|uniref:uncharacterized protein n=1 Tax=Penicillium verrucosum TaxID=60171 RepID=UPI0025459CEF|nr:uncharacterized protein N7516_006181 [Penicillium verrucosum]KAJ5931692.1 hypothetical protein N7516_006181 [Penicillium verrucosum]